MELLIPIALMSINLCLMLGLTFGVLILLRPVTRRLLRPKHQVVLWFAGWIMGFNMSLYTTCGKLLPLPFTFRGLLMPKGAIPGQPAFLALASDPEQAEVLSRGSLFPLPLSDRAAQILTIIWLVFLVALVAAWLLQDFRLRQVMQRGTTLPQESLSSYGLLPDTAVYLCPGLPTSFVRYGAAFSIADERHLICLQKELPPEQMRLVLLHECTHLRLHHAWFKAIMMLVVLRFAWNPLIWAAYRLTCRDIELACDEAVMEQLTPTDRRNYARALVELGSGRCLLGGTASFSECDTVLRVKRLVNWQPWTPGNNARSLVLTVLFILFFFCGGSPL